jgi:hypothetical protein
MQRQQAEQVLVEQMQISSPPLVRMESLSIALFKATLHDLCSYDQI